MRDEKDYMSSGSYEDPKIESVDSESKKVMTPTERGSNGPRTVDGITCNSPKVRVRKRPSLSADVLTILEKGTEVKILNKDGDFYRVRFNTNELGYIHQDYCEKI